MPANTPSTVRAHSTQVAASRVSSPYHVRVISAASGSIDMTNTGFAPGRRITARTLTAATFVVAALSLAACGGKESHAVESAATAAPARVDGKTFRVTDTIIDATIDASGIAEPMQQAMLSTKLMGTVLSVSVHEGDVVRAGQEVVRIDARELTAKASQVAASIADAEAMQQEAATNAARFRALYNDSAATRAQYDAAQTGLARADAGLRAARAAASELEAVSSYASVRAPFAGVVTQRMADPGMFAAPGAPLVTVQDVSQLRLSATATAESVRSLARGQQLRVTIDGVAATARVEGIVPANAGNLFTVNATLPNRDGKFRAGSAVMLQLPSGTTHALLVPLSAIVRDGDLTGVIVRGPARDERRWVRLGATNGTHVDVTSGLRAGEEVVVPAAPAAAKAPGA